MILSKNAKKLLFFWVVFHSIGYFSYLLNIHPSFEYETSDDGYSPAVYTNYLLTPDVSEEVEKENFYPFHKFTTYYYTSSAYGTFVGIYGYYGNSEYLFYVVLPLFVIFLIWVYKRFIE